MAGYLAKEVFSTSKPYRSRKRRSLQKQAGNLKVGRVPKQKSGGAVAPIKVAPPNQGQAKPPVRQRVPLPKRNVPRKLNPQQIKRYKARRRPIV